MNIGAFEGGTIDDKVYTDSSISFTWKSQKGEALIYVTVYFLNNGRSVNVDYDIQSSYIYFESASEKVEIKTKKIISIKGLNFYAIWSVSPTYVSCPFYPEYNNSNIKDKLKIEKYETQTIETNKKTNQQKVSIRNIRNIEKVNSLEVRIGFLTD